jgi:hypothetical protein
MKGSSELESWATVQCLVEKKDYGWVQVQDFWIRAPEGESLWKCPCAVICTQALMREHTCIHTDACMFIIVGLLIQIHSYTHTQDKYTQYTHSYVGTLVHTQATLICTWTNTIAHSHMCNEDRSQVVYRKEGRMCFFSGAQELSIQKSHTAQKGGGVLRATGGCRQRYLRKR